MVIPANLSRDSQDGEEITLTQTGQLHKSNDNGIVFSGANNPYSSNVQIIDIRQSQVEFALNGAITEGLKGNTGEKTLPTMLLYDEAGLKWFEAITYVQDYYLTNAEIEVLTKNADEIAARVPDGALLVELGSGNLRKVNILLQALETAQKRVDYFALDLSRPELERTFSQLPNGGFKYVRCYGLHGTYDDGRKWLQENKEIRDRPRFILWLGSSIGNLERSEAEAFLGDWRKEVIRPGSQDRMLVAFDSCCDAEKVFFAYNDRERVTEKFILNGLKNANNILGSQIFDLDKWEYWGEYDIVNRRHQAFYLAKEDMVLQLPTPVQISKGEKVRVERSHKFSDNQTAVLFEKAGLLLGSSWGQEDGDYALHLVYNPVLETAVEAGKYAKDTCPDVAEWKELWKLWDLVTRRMVRKEDLLAQPISLRNPILFYLGHIPTFLDVQISKATGTPKTEPQHYQTIFQRGIDPDVDDPTQCHSHSEIPNTWPDVDEIVVYQGRVRARISKMYETGDVGRSLDLRRALWLGFEHEIMHLETLLYMLLQHDMTVPPAGVPIPDFKAMYLLDLAKKSDVEMWLDVPAREIVLGVEDCEDKGGHFGWDNERPSIAKSVKAFQVSSRPITNGEYAEYMAACGIESLPKSWTREGRNLTQDTIIEADPSIETSVNLKGIFVKTVFGPVPFIYAQYWPVMASYDEINACAKYMGGRLPTREELQVVFDHVEIMKKDMECKKLAAMIDAVNGHLSMGGVHISPPELSDELIRAMKPEVKSGLFANLHGANVSFRQWHPSNVKGKLVGRGDGGLWEWTSTVLKEWEGFKPMDLYPEYTSDFFDDKHNIVLGASWATHSRVAGRKSFVNWYQRAYQYTWCTGRLVRDL